MSKPYTAGSTLHLMGETFEFDTAREAIMYLKRTARDGEEAVYDLLAEAFQGPVMCECEIDWLCPLCKAAGAIFTPEERRLDAWASLDREPW